MGLKSTEKNYRLNQDTWSTDVLNSDETVNIHNTHITNKITERPNHGYVIFVCYMLVILSSKIKQNK